MIVEFTHTAAETGISILQSWVTGLTLRMQGVLVTGLRGCDGYPKEDWTKTVLRAIRNKVLVPADARELAYKGGFMSYQTGELAALKLDLDQYPVHFVTHIMHACEVIGYKHPDVDVRVEFFNFYLRLAQKMHLNIESELQFDARMMEDRIANSNVTDEMRKYESSDEEWRTRKI